MSGDMCDNHNKPSIVVASNSRMAKSIFSKNKWHKYEDVSKLIYIS